MKPSHHIVAAGIKRCKSKPPLVTGLDKQIHKRHYDGYGHAAGFDISIEREAGRYLQGRVSYSFIYARFINPGIDRNELDNTEVMFTSRGAPVGEWFYPSYHRFHTFNMVLDIKPVYFFTLSPNMTIATGIPKPALKKAGPSPAVYDGQNGQRYEYEYSYDDELRTNISIPVGLKASFKFVVPENRTEIEFYVAADNITGFFYQPETGKYLSNSFNGSAIPMTENYNYLYPTFGVVIRY